MGTWTAAPRRERRTAYRLLVDPNRMDGLVDAATMAFADLSPEFGLQNDEVRVEEWLQRCSDAAEAFAFEVITAALPFLDSPEFDGDLTEDTAVQLYRALSATPEGTRVLRALLRQALADGLIRREVVEVGRRPLPRTVRQQVLDRDRGRCVKCGSAQTLEVDHITPYAISRSHHLSNLQTLCGDCHRAKTAKERKRIAQHKQRTSKPT